MAVAGSDSSSVFAVEGSRESSSVSAAAAETESSSPSAAAVGLCEAGAGAVALAAPGTALSVVLQLCGGGGGGGGERGEEEIPDTPQTTLLSYVFPIHPCIKFLTTIMHAVTDSWFLELNQR